jgi:hypothetical protein
VLDYSFNEYVGSGTAGSSEPYGTVSLDNNNGGPDVTVTVSLAQGVGFVNTGAGYSLTWDLNGVSPITVTGLTQGFSLVATTAGTLSANASGSWQYAVSCDQSLCGNGGSKPDTSPLSFTIDNVSLSDFVANGKNDYFGSDVCIGVVNGKCGSGGVTGVVVATAQTTGTSSVPEPTTIALFGAALGSLVLLRRRHRA